MERRCGRSSDYSQYGGASSRDGKSDSSSSSRYGGSPAKPSSSSSGSRYGDSASAVRPVTSSSSGASRYTSDSVRSTASSFSDSSRYGSSPAKPKPVPVPVKYGGKPSGQTSWLAKDRAGEPSRSTPPHLAPRASTSFSSAPVPGRAVRVPTFVRPESPPRFGLFGSRREGVPYKRLNNSPKKAKAVRQAEEKSSWWTEFKKRHLDPEKED